MHADVGVVPADYCVAGFGKGAASGAVPAGEPVEGAAFEVPGAGAMPAAASPGCVAFGAPAGAACGVPDAGAAPAAESPGSE